MDIEKLLRALIEDGISSDNTCWSDSMKTVVKACDKTVSCRAMIRALYTASSGTAEDMVRTWNVGALANVGMSWRHHPPSEPQLELLRKLGLKGTPRNKGEAADWITVKMVEGR